MAFEVIQGFDVSKNEPVDAVRVTAADETAMLAIKWVYDGLRVTRLDSTPRKVFICTVATATLSGPAYTVIADWEEFTGTSGIDGINGSQIFTDAGDPSDLLGDDGDFYLNSTSGDYFTKASGTWGVAQGNLTGPQGIIGLTGLTGADGVDGDTYATTSVTSVDFGGTVDPLTITTVDTGLDYSVGQTVIVASRGTLTNSLTGVVESYDGVNTLILNTLVYSGTGSSIDLDVNLSGAPGPAGGDGTDGTDGVDGAVGIALIHTESDVTLDDAKITSVQSGSWTIQVPWSGSIQTDTRSNQNTPSGIIGPQDKNSVSYNGTVWINNGRWVGQDGSNGVDGDTPYIQDGNWWIDGVDTGLPVTGPAGADGEGIVEYHHDVTSNMSGSQVMGLPYDFNIACVLHLHIAAGKYIVLPALSGTWPNSKIREIKVTRLDPYFSAPGVCKVWGRIVGNSMQTFPTTGGLVTQPNFPELDIGETGSFKPVTHAGGGYDSWWTAQISGRGMELYSKQRDYTASSVLRTGSQDKIQGYFSMRVVDNVCHYGGWFKVKNHNGIYSIIDYFQIGPENPFPYLPDPENGALFGGFDGTGPGTRMLFPLTTTGSNYEVLSFNPVGMFPISDSPPKNDLSVGLYYDGSEGLITNKVRLQVKIANSESHTGGYPRFFTFSGSYTTVSQITATAFYV